MGATVTIGSKLPIDLIWRLKDKSGEFVDLVIKGVKQRPGQMTAQNLVGGEMRALKYAGNEQTFVEGAAALTHNVDAELAAQGFKEYAKAPYVAKGMVFTASSSQAVAAMAKERRELRTGLEGINMDAPGPNQARDTEAEGKQMVAA